MTLLAYCGLVQRERIEAQVDHARALREAMRVNAAFAAPKVLEQEQRELMAALRRTTTASTAPALSREDAIRFTHDLLTRAGFVRADADPVS